jgi:hypothetical protein
MQYSLPVSLDAVAPRVVADPTIGISHTGSLGPKRSHGRLGQMQA